jgi:hypothetical protein
MHVPGAPFFYSFLQSKTLAQRDICCPVTTIPPALLLPSQVNPTPPLRVTPSFHPLFVFLSPFYVFQQCVLHRIMLRNRHAVALWCAATRHQVWRHMLSGALPQGIKCAANFHKKCIHSHVMVRKSNMLN